VADTAAAPGPVVAGSAAVGARVVADAAAVGGAEEPSHVLDLLPSSAMVRQVEQLSTAKTDSLR
jgi:hypothetical protein